MTEHSGDGGQRSDAKAAWSDAGDRLGVLGSRLKQHYEARSGSSGGQAGEEVKDAARRIGEAVQSAFDAIGSAAKDPAVKDDVRQVGRSVSDALAGTMTGLSDELRKTFGRQDEAVRSAGPQVARPSNWPTDDPDQPPPATPTDGPSHGTPEGKPPGTPQQ